MAPESLAERVSRYLQRHCSYFEETLSRLQSADFSRDEVVRDFIHRTETASQLDSEQAALLNEWQGGRDATEAERATVRALAGRATELSDRLRDAYAKAEMQVLATAASVQLQADEVRRGADIAGKFGLSEADTGGFLDHSA